MPSLTSLPSPAPGGGLPCWFRGGFAASFVFNFCLREFLLSALVNRFELRCGPRRLMLLCCWVCPCWTCCKSQCSFQARREAGWLGGFSSPNNLLQFVDFVSEKGCKRFFKKVVRMNEDSNSFLFEKATRIYPKCNIFLYHTSQKIQNFHGSPSLVVILCLRQRHIFQKWGVFQ